VKKSQLLILTSTDFRTGLCEDMRKLQLRL
jgi:hypothetical protein